MSHRWLHTLDCKVLNGNTTGKCKTGDLTSEVDNVTIDKMGGGAPGIELGTSATRKQNHTTRPCSLDGGEMWRGHYNGQIAHF